MYIEINRTVLKRLQLQSLTNFTNAIGLSDNVIINTITADPESDDDTDVNDKCYRDVWFILLVPNADPDTLPYKVFVSLNADGYFIIELDQFIAFIDCLIQRESYGYYERDAGGCIMMTDLGSYQLNMMMNSNKTPGEKVAYVVNESYSDGAEIMDRMAHVMIEQLSDIKYNILNREDN